MAEMLSVEERELETRRGPRRVLVVTPHESIEVGRARLQRPLGRSPSAADQWFLDTLLPRCADASAIVFRGRGSDGAPMFSFDASLDDDEFLALACELQRGQVMVYRQLFRAGIDVHAHVDWGHREVVAFKHANDVVARELEELIAVAGDPESETSQRLALELWTLRNQSFFFTLSFDALMSSVLPGKLPLLEANAARVRERLRRSEAFGRGDTTRP